MNKLEPYLNKDQRFDLLFIDNIRFHFIIGKSRSGTTLLSSLVSKNPQILATHEAQFMLVFYKQFKHKINWTKKDVRFILKNLWIRQELMREQWQIDMAFLEGLLFHHLKDLNYQRFCKIVYTCHHNYTNQIDTILDKNPIYSLHLDKWIDLFPEAKFIILVRDYRDQYISMNKDKLKPYSSKGLTFMWSYHYHKIQSNPQLNETNHIYLKFEDLINKSQKTLQKTAFFLKIDNQYSSENNDAFIKKPSVNSNPMEQLFYQHHQKANQAIETKKQTDWSVIPKEYLIDLEAYNGQLGEQWGYLKSTGVSNKKINFFKKNLIRFFSERMYSLPIFIQKFIYSLGRFLTKIKTTLPS